jgi:DNA-directed RNA polymerase specialized sigma subunit
MSKWKKLLERQMSERVDLIAKQAQSGKTMKEAANELGISKQQIYQIAKRENITFEKTFPYQRNFKKD